MIKLLQGDALALLKSLKPNVINTCITSPPYWGLRDYGMPNQLGLEKSPQEYVTNLVEIFREVRRVLRDDGTLWLNLGDCYAGSGKGGNPGHSPHVKQKTNEGSLSVRNRKQDTGSLRAKQLLGIPWRLAFALQDTDWFLRSAIIWAKPNGMPGSQQDRCSTSYEMVFHLSKEARYWSDFDAIKTPPKESTRVRVAQNIQMQAGSHRANAGAKTNGTMKAVGGGKPVMMRDVWFIAPRGFKEAHFATFPEELAERCALAGCPPNGVILDPFAGSGTVGMVANKLNRHAILFELNSDYIEIAKRRCGLAPAPLTRIQSGHDPFPAPPTSSRSA